jgi:hypothetical protein
MALIRTCSGVFSTSPVELCGYRIAVQDIKPGQETVDLYFDDRLVPGVGNVSFSHKGYMIGLKLLQKSEGDSSVYVVVRVSDIEAIRKELVTNLTNSETVIKIALAISTQGDITYISKRTEGSNTVFLFEFSVVPDYVQFGGGAGLARFIAKNFKTIAVLFVSILGFAVIWKWQDAVTKTEEVKGDISNTVKELIIKILQDPTMTDSQKSDAIAAILKAYYPEETSTDWETIIIALGAIAAAAYLLKGKI